MKIRREGTELFHVGTRTDRQTERRIDRQTDIMKLIVTFRNFANAPNNYRWDSESGQKLEARLLEKRQKKYFLRIHWESNMCPIWCPQYITRIGLDRDFLGDLFSNPANIKEIFFTPVQTGTGANTVSYTIGTVTVSQGWSGWGVALTTHPHLAPWSRISNAVTLLSLCASHDTWRVTLRAVTHYPHVTWAHVILRALLGC